MKKKKKIKISIISAVVAVVLIAGGLVTYLLLSKTDDNKKLKTLLANVSSQIFATYNDLAESYNTETSAQAVCYSSPSNINISVVASPVSETENDDIWNLTQGTDTFQDYLDNINNVMAHYAIAEYLVTENNNIDLSKTYHFISSTVEYYATANYIDNKYFSFTIQNDDEKIRVRINIQDGENLGESIEFFKEAKIDGNKYYYQYSILNFNTSKYAEISLTAKNVFSGVFDKYWLNTNAIEHNEHEINHKDKNSFIGKKYQRNDTTADETNQTTQTIFDKINSFKDKLFGNFNESNNDKKDVEEFPNAQGMQDYAFNKYVAKIITGSNGKQVLSITRAYQWVDFNNLILSHNIDDTTKKVNWTYKSDVEVINQYANGELIDINSRSIELYKVAQVGLIFECKKGNDYYKTHLTLDIKFLNKDEIFKSSNFIGKNYSWEFKDGFEAIAQIFNEEIIANNVRSINLAEFDNPISNELLIICKKDGEYYLYYSAGSTTSSSDENHVLMYEKVNGDNVTSKIKLNIQNFSIISWGYNKLQANDADKNNPALYTYSQTSLSNSNQIKPIDNELELSTNSFDIVEYGLYEFVVYFRHRQKFYKETLKVYINNEGTKTFNIKWYEVNNYIPLQKQKLIINYSSLISWGYNKLSSDNTITELNIQKSQKLNDESDITNLDVNLVKSDELVFLTENGLYEFVVYYIKNNDIYKDYIYVKPTNVDPNDKIIVISYSDILQNSTIMVSDSDSVKSLKIEDNATIISWGYNNIDDEEISGTIMNMQHEEPLDDISQIEKLDVELENSQNVLNITKRGIYEIVVYYKMDDQYYRSSMYITASLLLF